MIAFQKFNTQFNFAFIDESTKREIRRKLLKAICIPGYQVPYSSPEMPIARGWGTGGLHVTLSLIGRQDVFKIIDQGSDASVNACNLRDFVRRTTDCRTTFDTREATLIQSRHRITEETLSEHQILVFQVPQPEPLRGVERYERKTREMHGEADYAKMWVSLYESYVKYGDIMEGAGYPVKVNERYIMSPSPIPRWDVPNLNHSQCLFLFGAGREKRLYAVPPHTTVTPLEFEDVRFRTEKFPGIRCAMSGAEGAFMDELYGEDTTSRHVVNDSDFLDKLLANDEPPRWENPYLREVLDGLDG
ncbi:MAG: alpha-D-ribose 1-methylphosphonate 5-phosphate C-P-lyase PhnJ [Ferruginibacter sp.]|nr:alpha-D-ribose 1-methylphosphonate 5-phosphate C-P-lyase PhnJ [Cytophagales bacterium]